MKCGAVANIRRFRSAMMRDELSNRFDRYTMNLTGRLDLPGRYMSAGRLTEALATAERIQPNQQTVAYLKQVLARLRDQ